MTESAPAGEASPYRLPDGVKLPDGTRWAGHHVLLERFEGPLDLLLHLIRDRQISIREIQIAEITDQFMEHVRGMNDADGQIESRLDAAGDFLVMAATLIQLKTRELLPRDEISEAEEEEMSREDLIRLLEEYERFKAAAAGLERRMHEQSRIFLRTRPAVDPQQEEVLKVDLTRLISAFRTVLRRAPIEEVQEMAREPVRLEERLALIIELLERRESVLFEEIFAGVRRRDIIIVTFLALLDLMRSGRVAVTQSASLGDIRLARRDESLIVEESAVEEAPVAEEEPVVEETQPLAEGIELVEEAKAE
jgi:segregation and condensation protein A